MPATARRVLYFRRTATVFRGPGRARQTARCALNSINASRIVVPELALVRLAHSM